MKRDLLLTALLAGLWFTSGCLRMLGAAAGDASSELSSRISLACGNDCLWALRSGERTLRFGPPAFELDGKPVEAKPALLKQVGGSEALPNGSRRYRFAGAVAGDGRLALELDVELNDTPIVRFRYVLTSSAPRRLTKSGGHDAVSYFATSFGPGSRVHEVEFSNFLETVHSYSPSELELSHGSAWNRGSAMGPMLTGSDGSSSFLVAYEHGSQSPDAFLTYELGAGSSIRLKAVKGNYWTNQLLDAGHPFRSAWFEAGASRGGEEELASDYRRFALRFLSQNSATRKPYVFYNTWNFQERNKWWNGKQYLDSMREERILREIDVAHRMGIDVFVLDTGWYEKTGDWAVSRERFPDGLKPIKAKLDGYGMKLGLWFGPTSAAVTSKSAVEHPDWRMSWNGKVDEPSEIWGTEASYPMCLVSGYADAFADRLIELAKELGVTYFKWDAVGQYGCNDPHHLHGDASVSAEERKNSYGYQLPLQLGYIADKVAAAVPGTIVDFDATEGGRPMGLAFLTAGRYFAVNNGPYYASYDIPTQSNPNVFFYPGAARTWIARAPLSFDRWVPANLFLTHYLPDDDRASQEVNLASLVLGQNGFWGDLLSVSPPGVEFIGKTLGKYRVVREDVAASDPVVTGDVSGSPEVHEKISEESGRGVVSIFATTAGKYEYRTVHRVEAKHWSTSAVTVTRDAEGHAHIEADFDKPGAKAIFFGTE